MRGPRLPVLGVVGGHHVTPRADGGTHDPETLMPLCGAHHRAVHDGALVITGTADATLEQTVRLALKPAPLPSSVREEVVPYQRCA